MKKNKKNINILNEDIIDFLPLLNKLYLNKIKIFKITFLFALLGVFISIFTEKKYISNLKFSLLASQNSSQSSSLSGLASLAGFDLNLNQSQKVLNPQLYSLVFNDFSFRRELLKIKLDDKLIFKDYIIMNSSPSLFDYVYHSMLFLPKKIVSILKPTNSNFESNYNIDKKYFITDEEKGLFSFINSSINLSFDQNKMIVNISSELNHPVYSTIVTKNAYKLLERKIIDLNIKSSNDVLNYNLKNYNDKKKEYIHTQNKLAIFKDNNQAISSSKFNVELFRLENEFKLINNVFQELSKQVELSKIQVTKDTPVFNILVDSSIPISNSKPKTLFIVVFSAIIGFGISSFYFLFKNLLFELFLKIRN